jgi:hypothetical protein
VSHPVLLKTRVVGVQIREDSAPQFEKIHVSLAAVEHLAICSDQNCVRHARFPLGVERRLQRVRIGRRFHFGLALVDFLDRLRSKGNRFVLFPLRERSYYEVEALQTKRASSAGSMAWSGRVATAVDANTPARA